MRQGEPIELFGLLRRKQGQVFTTKSSRIEGWDLLTGKPVHVERTTRQRDRMTVEFHAPEIYFNTSDASLARAFADTLTVFGRRMLQSGRDLAGKVMRPAAPATLERRKYRQEQQARGGQAAARYTSKKVRRWAAQRFASRFAAKRLGTFSPQPGAATFGTESGMLAASLSAVAEAGGTFRIFFAAKRAEVDKHGTSAVGRVFGPGKAATWSNESMRDPEIQTGLRDLARSLFQSRAQRLASELRDLGSNVAEIVNATQEAAEVDADAG